MHVRLNIDFEISPRMKRVLKFGIPITILLAGSVVFAGVPNTFKDGDALSAQTMNDNFAALDTRLANIEKLSAHETIDGGYAASATYCGPTTATTIGDMSGLSVLGSGYAKARSQCQITCGDPSAHMCSGDEVARTMALSIPVTVTGWYADSDATTACKGWHDGTNTQSGSVWSGTFPNTSTCDKSWPVMCCD